MPRHVRHGYLVCSRHERKDQPARAVHGVSCCLRTLGSVAGKRHGEDGVVGEVAAGAHAARCGGRLINAGHALFEEHVIVDVACFEDLGDDQAVVFCRYECAVIRGVHLERARDITHCPCYVTPISLTEWLSATAPASA